MITRGTPIIIGSQTAASIHTFAAMVAAGKVIVDSEEIHLPLRHSHHRYTIATAGGPLNLTVSITGSTNTMPVRMKDVEISEHAKWRHLHWGALFSAYGKTPYFDYIADDLKSIIAGNQTSLLEFNTQLQRLIIDFMDLPIEVTTCPVTPEIVATSTDLRRKLGTKKGDIVTGISDVPYYQLWSDKNGFLPNLSILDLLMNTGREAIFTLLKMVE